MRLGAPITLACISITVLYYSYKYRLRYPKAPSMATLIIFLINIFLTIKLVFFSSASFVLTALLVNCSIYLLFAKITLSLQNKKYSVRHTMSAVPFTLALFGLLLVFTNVFAVILFPGAAINSGGRLHGTTSNPQAIAMLSAFVIPSFVYVIRQDAKFYYIRAACYFCLPATFILLFLSGSRMGMGSGLMGFLIAAVGHKRCLRYVFHPRNLLASVAILLAISWSPLGDIMYGRFVQNRTDTRSSNWTWAWNEFLDSPFFGMVPTGIGGRYQFVENAWLAAISNGGLFIFLFCFVLLFSIIKVLFAVMRRKRWVYIKADEKDFFIASVITALGVSMFEAVFLGILATHTMIFYMILSGMYSILRTDSLLLRNRQLTHDR